MDFKKVNGAVEIKCLIEEFNDVFPHLHEKIQSLDEYAQRLSRCANVCIAVENSEVVGLVAFYANDTENQIAYISLIGVKSCFEGKGYGKALLEHCVLISKLNGMKLLKLEVDTDNARAIDFYRRNGFDGTCDIGKSSFYMSKKL